MTKKLEQKKVEDMIMDQDGIGWCPKYQMERSEFDLLIIRIWGRKRRDYIRDAFSEELYGLSDEEYKRKIHAIESRFSRELRKYKEDMPYRMIRRLYDAVGEENREIIDSLRLAHHKLWAIRVGRKVYHQKYRKQLLQYYKIYPDEKPSNFDDNINSMYKG